jgi:hypothetical protein
MMIWKVFRREAAARLECLHQQKHRPLINMIKKNKSLPIESSIDVLTNQRRTHDKSYGNIQEIYTYTDPLYEDATWLFRIFYAPLTS